MKITKIIQELISVEEKANKEMRFSGANYNQFFGPFYDALLEKVQSLKKPENYENVLSNRNTIEIDKKGTLIKKVTMEFSARYFADIVAHIMMIMDINFLESEELYKKVKNIFIELITNFTRLPLDTLKESILEEYYNDLVFSMVARCLQRTRHSLWCTNF
jgi:hypothetical protein